MRNKQIILTHASTIFSYKLIIEALVRVNLKKKIYCKNLNFSLLRKGEEKKEGGEGWI